MGNGNNRGIGVTSDGYHETAPERLRRIRDEIAAAAKGSKRSAADV
jgi:hypothetical protein